MIKLENTKNTGEVIGFKQALLPVVSMAILILLSVIYWDVPIQLALFFEIAITIMLAFIWGFNWQEIKEMLFSSFSSIGEVIMILFLIGMMIGVWIGVGTVPSMIYYGLQILNPRYFLVLSFILSSLVSLAVGTAIGTASTIGLALISIAEGLGLPLPLVAGAIISGCYVGDRTSPVSSIANITAHSAGVNIIEMVKHMLITIIPPFIISLFVYFFIGISGFVEGEEGLEFARIADLLSNNFFISGWLLLPPILIIGLAIYKTPTLINLMINIFFSLGLGLFFTERSWSTLLNTMFAGFKADTGSALLDNILSRGGLTSMLELISLIIFAVILGGLFERLGILNSILNKLVTGIKNRGQLITMTIFASIISAMLGCNQFLGVFLPGKMMGPKYDDLGVPRRDLGRALGDSGLIVSPLIPWNVNALMMTAVLGVDTMQYFKFAYLPLLLPLSSIVFAFLENNNKMQEK